MRDSESLCVIYRALSSRHILLLRLRSPLDLLYIGNPEITVMKVPVKIRFSGKRIAYIFFSSSTFIVETEYYLEQLRT